MVFRSSSRVFIRPSFLSTSFTYFFASSSNSAIWDLNSFLLSSALSFNSFICFYLLLIFSSAFSRSFLIWEFSFSLASLSYCCCFFKFTTKSSTVDICWAGSSPISFETSSITFFKKSSLPTFGLSLVFQFYSSFVSWIGSSVSCVCSSFSSTYSLRGESSCSYLEPILSNPSLIDLIVWALLNFSSSGFPTN